MHAFLQYLTTVCRVAVSMCIYLNASEPFSLSSQTLLATTYRPRIRFLRDCAGYWLSVATKIAELLFHRGKSVCDVLRFDRF